MRYFLSFLQFIKVIGMIFLAVCFCAPFVAIIQVYQKNKIEPTNTYEVPINNKYVYLTDPTMHCSPLSCDNMYFICPKHKGEDNHLSRKECCIVCGRCWHEHFVFVTSEKDWLKTCKEKDSYDYTNYYAPMGYGDL